jgi:hypothetical protein
MEQRVVPLLAKSCRIGCSAGFDLRLTVGNVCYREGPLSTTNAAGYRTEAHVASLSVDIAKAPLKSRRYSPRHLAKALQLPAQPYPRLGTVAIHFRLWLHPAAIVQSPDVYHRGSGHRVRLIQNSRAAFWAKAAMDRLARVPRFSERLQLSGHLEQRRADCDYCREGGPSEALAIGAVAHTDKEGFRVRAVAYFPA